MKHLTALNDEENTMSLKLLASYCPFEMAVCTLKQDVCRYNFVTTSPT